MFSLCEQGHYVKAKALSGLERTEEALKEFLYCVALNPEWSSMKKEAQKVSNVLLGYRTALWWCLHRRDCVFEDSIANF